MTAPRESLYDRVRIMLSEPGRKITTLTGPQGTALCVVCESPRAVEEFQRQYGHCMAILRNTTLQCTMSSSDSLIYYIR